MDPPSGESFYFILCWRSLLGSLLGSPHVTNLLETALTIHTKNDQISSKSDQKWVSGGFWSHLEHICSSRGVQDDLRGKVNISSCAKWGSIWEHFGSLLAHNCRPGASKGRKLKIFRDFVFSSIFLVTFWCLFKGYWTEKTLISCERGVKNHISTKLDFPWFFFGRILEVVLDAKSAQDPTLTHCGELQEQFLTPMKGVKFQTSVKSARCQMYGNPPPWDGEGEHILAPCRDKGNLTDWLLGVPGQRQVSLGVCGQSSVFSPWSPEPDHKLIP